MNCIILYYKHIWLKQYLCFTRKKSSDLYLSQNKNFVIRKEQSAVVYSSFWKLYKNPQTAKVGPSYMEHQVMGQPHRASEWRSTAQPTRRIESATYSIVFATIILQHYWNKNWIYYYIWIFARMHVCMLHACCECH